MEIITAYVFPLISCVVHVTVVCVCVHAVRTRGWGGRQNHESAARAALPSKPCCKDDESTNSRTTTNYTLLLFVVVVVAKNNISVTVSGAGS